MNTLESLYHLLQKDLDAVDAFIRKTLEETSQKSSIDIIEHLLSSPGKRVRPMLVILLARALAGEKEINETQLIQVASSIEIIHLASLVHDDIIDEADTRRNQATVNQKWGNEVAVAMGVYLYSISLQLIAQAQSIEILDIMSKAVKGMCDGELFQLADRHSGDVISETRYFDIIRAKTAELFMAATLSGAVVAGVEDKTSVKEFGLHLGYLFQITDDVLDVVGDSESLKKAAGQDLDQGQWTLPLIQLYEKATPDEKKQLETLMKSGCSLSDVQPLLDRYEIVSGLHKRCVADEDVLDTFLKTVPESDYKKALILLVSMIAGRVNWTVTV